MKSAQVSLEAAYKVLARAGAPAAVLDPLKASAKALKAYLSRGK